MNGEKAKELRHAAEVAKKMAQRFDGVDTLPIQLIFSLDFLSGICYPNYLENIPSAGRGKIYIH